MVGEIYKPGWVVEAMVKIRDGQGGSADGLQEETEELLNEFHEG